MNNPQLPSLTGQEIQPPRAVDWKYLALVGVLTIIAVVMCELSLHKVRLLLPEYPRLVTMGIYTPVAPVRFFHLLGSAALILVFLAASGVTILNRKFSLPLVLLRIAVAGHLFLLLSAAFAYGFCMWRISRVMAQLM